MTPREIENNAYAEFWGDKQRTLSVWYGISGVVNWPAIFLRPGREGVYTCQRFLKTNSKRD